MFAGERTDLGSHVDVSTSHRRNAAKIKQSTINVVIILLYSFFVRGAELLGGPAGQLARWAATSNIAGESGTEEGALT